MLSYLVSNILLQSYHSNPPSINPNLLHNPNLGLINPPQPLNQLNLPPRNSVLHVKIPHHDAPRQRRPHHLRHVRNMRLRNLLRHKRIDLFPLQPYNVAFPPGDLLDGALDIVGRVVARAEEAEEVRAGFLGGAEEGGGAVLSDVFDADL